jgi:CopG-like RHH_1 or ribbon-helix-helix domain, RHH_5
MPKRVTVTLADTVADKLQRWSDARGQAIATVAGIAIELALNEAESRGEIPSNTKNTTARKETNN